MYEENLNEDDMFPGQYKMFPILFKSIPSQGRIARNSKLNVHGVQLG